MEHKKWEDLELYEKKYIIALGARVISQPIAYLVWHKVFKAPKWAAWGITSILAGQALQNAKAEFDFARAVARVENPKAPEKTDDPVWQEFNNG